MKQVEEEEKFNSVTNNSSRQKWKTEEKDERSQEAAWIGI